MEIKLTGTLNIWKINGGVKMKKKINNFLAILFFVLMLGVLIYDSVKRYNETYESTK